MFSAIRQVIELFASKDPRLGLYGAFGYDLAYQFEPIRLRADRADRADGGQRDLVLHLPDELFVIDRKRETALRYSYDFASGGRSTAGLARITPRSAPARRPGTGPEANLPESDCPPDPVLGEYAKVVEQARERFAGGRPVRGGAESRVVGRGAARRPRSTSGCAGTTRPPMSPFSIWVRASTWWASPEMYVRVTGDRIETCPIAGTIARGATPLDDAENIRTLLIAKEESELAMCTDVDRNDKSRICVPGSIKVIGRRQIGFTAGSSIPSTTSRDGCALRFDALDAFLTHMWAVTVTGAPKTWAMQFIEDHKTSPRKWYGGAVGALGFDGNMNTGLTLRTAHIRDGLACVRAGATLLFDSTRPPRNSKPGSRPARCSRSWPGPLPTRPEPRRTTSKIRQMTSSRSRATADQAMASGYFSWTTKTRSCIPWPATSLSKARR